jgi:hypothetical protein
MYIGLGVKYLLFLSDINETGLFSADFEKNIDIKFNEDPFSVSLVVPCGRTYRHDQTNSRFSQCANAHKKETVFYI